MKTKAGLNDFTNWYEMNSHSLNQNIEDWEPDNQALKDEFLSEWPLTRLKNMDIDEYIFGKGPENQSFCYQIETGKYAELYMGIRGGAAGKFGMYFSRTKNGYFDNQNNRIPDGTAFELFKKYRSDLVEIIEKGINLEFNDPIFNEKTSKNLFIGKSAMITKLLCSYSKNKSFVGVNTSKWKFWNQFIKKDKQGSVYKQNFQIAELIHQKFPQLDGDKQTPLLYRYAAFRESQLPADLLESEKEKDRMITYTNELTNKIIRSKNVIFHGAPGTGKSYLAKEIATEIVSEGETTNYTDLSEDQKNQIEFVQFHPSYDYTDFVEGLRPIVNVDGSMSFELQEGVFKKFISRARMNLEDSEKTKSNLSNEKSIETKLTQFFDNIKFDTDTFETVNKTEFFIHDADDEQVHIVIPNNKVANQITLNIEDLKELLLADQNFEKVSDIREFFGKINSTQAYSYLLSLYKELAKLTVRADELQVNLENPKSYVFIIDEINRGEISKIFGELFFSIDPSYRGLRGQVTTQYANLHANRFEKFYVPNNVYIIGTMNDIDRSVDSFDFAMRRRFRFIKIDPNTNASMLDELGNEKSKIAQKRMISLNELIGKVEELGENYEIGASYFLKLNEISENELWNDYLEPLIYDYVRGLYNQEELINDFKNAFFLNSNPEV